MEEKDKNTLTLFGNGPIDKQALEALKQFKMPTTMFMKF